MSDRQKGPKNRFSVFRSHAAISFATMGERNKENGAAAGVGPASAGGDATPFVIPPLTKTSTGLQRRQELAERDRSLTEKLSEISLQSSNDDQSTTTAKTPGRKTKGGSSTHAPKTPGATPGRSRPAPVAMPSPGLRRIRERLGDEAKKEVEHQHMSREDLLAREQASRAMAEAERSAAAAIDAIFAQQEGTLLAMSAALKADSGSNSILLARIAQAVEETTREQLAALSGVSKEGDDILQTAVYWITLARFESNHGREEAARKYLTDGIACMEARQKESVGGAVANSTTQINALRMALDRMDQKMQMKKNSGEEEENQNTASEVQVEVAKPKPRLPPSAKANKSPSRRRSRSKGKEEAPVTPTRRSDRIKSKSAEKEKK